ncbi:unnamed protein product [Citrullus colocynthis]|uniref:Uncharacterized protein n=1 Tax=Citrullus colocynthis TaxID=252529 RepID=A0ABP0XMT6_9ROSI
MSADLHPLSRCCSTPPIAQTNLTLLLSPPSWLSSAHSIGSSVCCSWVSFDIRSSLSLPGRSLTRTDADEQMKQLSVTNDNASKLNGERVRKENRPTADRGGSGARTGGGRGYAGSDFTVRHRRCWGYNRQQEAPERSVDAWSEMGEDRRRDYSEEKGEEGCSWMVK